jgi:hypothetical protein
VWLSSKSVTDRKTVQEEEEKEVELVDRELRIRQAAAAAA